MVARKEHKNPAIYFGKFEWKNLLFQVWGFIFIPIIFSFVKAQFFFILKHFLKLRFFKSLGFFWNSDFYRLEQRACHIPAYHDCWLKENEKNGIDDQNGFYLLYASCPFR